MPVARLQRNLKWIKRAGPPANIMATRVVGVYTHLGRDTSGDTG